MTRRPGTVVAGLVVASTLLLGACGLGGLPSTGPVVEGRPLNEVINEQVRVVAVPPVDGASQEAVVRGFLRAGEDNDDTHATGKLFLAPQSVDLWSWSNEEVVVYNGELSVKRVDDDTVRVSAPVLARVSPDGRYVEQERGTRAELTLGLTKVGGEWRVELPRDGFGLWLDADQFNRIYTNRFVYYVAPGGRELVPDSRWFPSGSRLVTTLARAQLAGVPAHLAGAVTTGVPRGTTLAVDAVPVVGGTAQVNLSSQALSANPAARSAMWAQLTKTLLQVPAVGSVALAVDTTPLELPGGVTSVSTSSELGYDIVPKENLDTALVRRGDTLRRIDPRYVPDTTELTKRPNLGPQDGDVERIPDTWVELALSVDSKQVAAVSRDLRDLSIWRATEATRRIDPFATDLSKPVYDADGYLWIAGADDRGDEHIYVLDSVSSDPDVAPKAIKVPWLENRRVIALAVSPDAARLLVVTSDLNSNDVQLGLSGIVRAGNGEPTGLVAPLRQAQSLEVISDVTWLDPVNYAVLGQVRAGEPTRPWLGTLGAGVDGAARESGRLSAVPGAVSVTTVGGPRGIVIVTSDNRILARAGSTWRSISDRGSDILVPGG